MFWKDIFETSLIYHNKKLRTLVRFGLILPEIWSDKSLILISFGLIFGLPAQVWFLPIGSCIGKGLRLLQ